MSARAARTITLRQVVERVHKVHDALEDVLREGERRSWTEPQREAWDLLWRAHDLVERATLKLHVMLDPQDLHRVLG